MPKTKMPADLLISRGVLLLQLLTRAPEQTIDQDEACSELGIERAELQLVADAVSDLFDRTSGARAVVSLEDNEVSLLGEAGRLHPIRLSMSDAAVLRHVLSSLNISDEVRQRVESALVDPASLSVLAVSVAESKRYGLYYQQLTEAIADGVRCRIEYRSSGDETPSKRIIDPLSIIDRDGLSYLEAWDTAKDAQRSYRLDRISDVAFTEESVDEHQAESMDVAKTLAAGGVAVTLRTCNLQAAKNLTWAGIANIESNGDGGAYITANIASEPWLFDRVLASVGELTILEPEDIKQRFRDYAKALLIS